MAVLFNRIRESIKGTILGYLRGMSSDNPDYQYEKRSYSQEGEDILLKRIFSEKNDGFYIDIGAHHPFRFSNTMLLYDRGWNGVNIEPNPDVIDLFRKNRTRDINICAAVSSKPQKMIYYRYHHPALNTFDETLVAERKKKPVSTEMIQTTTLKELLNSHLMKGQHIDLMSIDVEGLDFEVLKSNDWDKYVPDFIIVELPLLDIPGVLEHPISVYLQEKNYVLHSKLWKSCIFQKQKPSIG